MPGSDRFLRSGCGTSIDCQGVSGVARHDGLFEDFANLPLRLIFDGALNARNVFEHRMVSQVIYLPSS